MIMSYIDLYRKQKNISVGKITTVFCGSGEEVVSRIRALVVEKNSWNCRVSKTKIDPKLEGGFTL